MNRHITFSQWWLQSTSPPLGSSTANTSRVGSMEALLKSQEYPMSVNRRAIWFQSMRKHSLDDSRWIGTSPSASVCHTSPAPGLSTANTSRVRAKVALLESQESQIALNRKTIWFQSMGKHSLDESRWIGTSHSASDGHTSPAVGLWIANTSRVDRMKILLESQEYQISLNRKTIQFQTCANNSHDSQWISKTYLL